MCFARLPGFALLFYNIGGTQVCLCEDIYVKTPEISPRYIRIAYVLHSNLILK